MSKLIIVCGLSGSGKTTLVKELSKELKIFCLQKDFIKENLYESLGCSTLEDSKRLGLPSIKLIFKLAEEAIKNGVDIMIEGTFCFDGDVDLFKEWQKKYDLDVYSVICSIDQKEREKRFTKRPRHRAHHDDERIKNGEADNEEWVFRKNFDYDVMPDKKIKITTNKPVDELVNKIIKVIS